MRAGALVIVDIRGQDTAQMTNPISPRPSVDALRAASRTRKVPNQFACSMAAYEPYDERDSREQFPPIASFTQSYRERAPYHFREQDHVACEPWRLGRHHAKKACRRACIVKVNSGMAAESQLLCVMHHHPVACDELSPALSQLIVQDRRHARARCANQSLRIKK